jgi:hypothetical protein
MTRLAKDLLLVLAALTACGRGHEVKANSPAQLQMDILTAKLDKGEMGRVEILQLPDDIETDTRISPAVLESSFDYKLTISGLHRGRYQQKLTEVVKTIVVRPETEMPDLRWGVVFYGADNTRLASLYFDKWGGKGGVGDTPVSFGGGFFRWMHKFSDGFQ